MSAPRDPDVRIQQWLVGEAPNDIPHHVLSAALDRTRTLPQERSIGGRGLRGRVRLDRRRTLMLVAALVPVLFALAVGAGALRTPAPTVTPPASVLDDLRRDGRVRIAVRPDHPQSPLSGVATGFDTDVATALADRLGLQPDLVIEDVSTMLGPDRGTWDLALPSTPDWLIDDAAFAHSAPYYRWTHRLVVPAASAASSIADLAGGPICAVAGDPTETWLRGGYGGASASPAATSIVTRATDADCLAALTAGDAIGAVTAHLSDADISVIGEFRVIGGPDAEPRSVVVRRPADPGADPGDLLAAVDDAIGAMRADGTLTQLSERRFGGADLTGP